MSNKTEFFITRRANGNVDDILATQRDGDYLLVAVASAGDAEIMTPLELVNFLAARPWELVPKKHHRWADGVFSKQQAAFDARARKRSRR